MNKTTWLRPFSKLTCLATLFLIFAGGMVTSTGSGLSVPDWPLSYGMLFPPMVGGVFYEHGHRMVATVVGFLILVLAVGVGFTEQRRWVKTLSFCALGTVIVQGVLGGITVLFFLPTPVSVAHGVLAQTFFVLTIIIAYSFSKERETRQTSGAHSAILKTTAVFCSCVYFQLIFGAVMRHTHSGLAIPDFPTMGGEWIPMFDKNMLAQINDWRFLNNFDPVTMTQVVYHFVHRLMAVIILVALIVLNIGVAKHRPNDSRVSRTLFCLNTLIVLQITLGIFTVLTQKAPLITSLHVMVGAATLGVSVLLMLRASPTSFEDFKKGLFDASA